MSDQILETLRIKPQEDVPDNCLPLVGVLIYETLHEDGKKKIRLSHELWEAYDGQTDDILDLEIRSFLDEIAQEGFIVIKMYLTFIDTSDEEAGILEIWKYREKYYQNPWQAAYWSDGRSVSHHILILEAQVVKMDVEIEVWPPETEEES